MYDYIYASYASIIYDCNMLHIYIYIYMYMYVCTHNTTTANNSNKHININSERIVKKGLQNRCWEIDGAWRGSTFINLRWGLLMIIINTNIECHPLARYCLNKPNACF